MTDTEGAPTVRRERVATTDVDESTAWLCTRYGEHQPAFDGDRDAFTLRLTSTAVESAAGWLRADRFQHSMRMRAPTDPARELLLTVPISGRIRHTAGRDTTSSICLVPYWQYTVTEWEDVDLAIGLLDLDGVRRVGAEQAGIDPARVQFTAWTPISPAWGDVVAATLSHVRDHVLALDAAVAGPFLHGEAYRHLASTLLAAFPNTTHRARPVRDAGGSATVRRATEFIDAHATEDIDLARIAEAAGVGPRGLQAAFARHRDQTPMQYLRRARLEGAHRDLRAGDPTRGDTVGAIAARWGFPHPGRFAVAYHAAYGRPPGSTLRE